jgi:adenylosuccinate synthase
MSGIVILGTQWGDEGKGKIVDILSSKAAMVARYQGGHNAGHTVCIQDKTFILHLIPTGILRPGVRCVIGNGVAVDPKALVREIDLLRENGIRVEDNLYISRKAHLIFPFHQKRDLHREEAKGTRKIGTTGRGIGPAYSDKMARIGIRVEDLEDKDLLAEKLHDIASEENSEEIESIYNEYLELADRLKNFFADCSVLVNAALDRGERVIFEGAQGTLLDVDHGTYPYVTSSNCTAGGACVGLGVAPTRIHGVVGITKAYTTRVGNGPFPTEQKNGDGAKLQTVGNEFGATTGRVRRCGWLDLVVLKYSRRLNDFKTIVLTKLDVLDSFQTIPVAIAYRIRGEKITDFSFDETLIEEAEPIYRQVKGWESSTKGLTSFEGLPTEARDYIRMIEDFLEVEVKIISTGPGREEAIFKENLDCLFG